MRKRNFEYCNLDVIVSALAHIYNHVHLLLGVVPFSYFARYGTARRTTPNVDNYRKVEYMDEKHIGGSGALQYRL